MPKKRTCSGNCKKFRASKPLGTGRYQTGQGRCQICEIWLDYRGAHTKDGKPATNSSVGWYCNCCNYRIRRNPRSINYKAKMRQSRSDKTYGDDVDLSYFNKRRACMLRDLGRAIAKKESKNSTKHYGSFLPSENKPDDIESEFDTGLDKLVELAKTIDPPNKVSMIAEFERIRHALKRTPTKQDVDRHSMLKISEYEEEFRSWEHLLDRMGYDPWYQNDRKPPGTDLRGTSHKESDSPEPVNRGDSTDYTRLEITDRLKNDPDMLRAFAFVDRNIPAMDPSEIRSILSSLDDD